MAGGPRALGRFARRRTPTTIVIAICLALAGMTLAVAAIRAVVPDVAPVYLLAVLAVGMLYGTLPAVVTSVAAFLLYDFLFVPPIYTFTIASPDEWLNLLLLLAVAVVIGRLAALQTQRAQEAADRALEAESLYGITGVLASTRTVGEAAPIVLARLAAATAMDRAWFGLGPSPTEERVVADTAAGEALPMPGWHRACRRSRPISTVMSATPSRRRGSGRPLRRWRRATDLRGMPP